MELLAIGGRDSRGFLPSVLQRVEAEVGQVGRLGVTVDTEHATFVTEVVVFVCSSEDRQVALHVGLLPWSCLRPLSALEDMKSMSKLMMSNASPDDELPTLQPPAASPGLAIDASTGVAASSSGAASIDGLASAPESLGSGAYAHAGRAYPP
jgi:hypothetical protein